MPDPPNDGDRWGGAKRFLKYRDVLYATIYGVLFRLQLFIVSLPIHHLFFLDRERDKWAFCFHPERLTLGVTSTRRIKAFKTAVKRRLDKNGTLRDLVNVTSKIELDQRIDPKE